MGVKNLIIFLISLFSISAIAQPTFSIKSVTGSFEITCANPTVFLYVIQTPTIPVTFTCNGVSGTTVPITAAGTYSLYCLINNTVTIVPLTILANTTVPVSLISPLTSTFNQVQGPQTVSLTAITPTSGINHTIVSSIGQVLATSPNPSFTFLPPKTQGIYFYCLTDTGNGCKTCSKFFVNEIFDVSINERSKFQISMYPVPAADYLRFEGLQTLTTSKVLTIEIMNSLGQLVHKTQINPQIFNQINIKNLVNGLYFIRFKSQNNEVFANRFLVEK